MGGLIAVAVASLLEAANREVVEVTLLDSRLLHEADDAEEVLREAAEVFQEAIGTLLSEGEARQSVFLELLDRRRPVAEKEKLLRERLAWKTAPSTATIREVARQADLLQRHAELMRGFVPPTIAAPLALFWAEEEEKRGAARTDWARFTEGRVLREQRVGGDHFSMLRPPHLANLAKELGFE
jgi:thioesterase domain-containing protein